MNCATKRRQTQILVWLIWAMSCGVFIFLPEWVLHQQQIELDLPALPGVAMYDQRNGPLFPWHPKHRVRKWAW